MKRIRIYIDTSIIGGCFDKEFSHESNLLMKMAEQGNIVLLVSDLLADELEESPPEVQILFANIPSESIEQVFISEESEALCSRYLAENVVGPGSSNDAHHVAIATVARADIIVSWNFKHLVHYEKIRGFNAVNLREGYPIIEIRSPKDIVNNEEDI